MTATGVKHEMPPPAVTARRGAADVAALLALPARRPRRPAGSAPMLPARLLVTAVLAAALAIGGAMVFLDAWAFAQVKHLPLWLIDLFNEITDYGRSGWFLWPIGFLIVALAAAAAAAPGRFVRLTVISLVVRLEFIFAAIAVPGLVVTFVKRLIGRVRPSALGPFAYVPFSWRPDYASMPSGHATTAFAAAVALGAVWPRARPLLWLYAVVIALSRVIIAAHYPSDVIAGACVGAFAAIIIRDYFAARRLGFAAERDGTVRALPGPSWRRLTSVAARLLPY
ncbi:MAG TPA: phosphatase PAP2 family protein [Xanthobacteraceae bacterium]|nr:phosphatase PAP2 family protein [Xanthobacteraceae bacterium]